MNAYATGTGSFSESFERILDTVETELRHAVAFVDAVVVPQVRRESGFALRTLAGHMEKFADRLDPAHPQPWNGNKQS